MSDEFTAGFTARFSKGNAFARLSRQGLTFDVAGTKYKTNVQEIGTTEEAIDLGDAGVGGYFAAVNLDDTNFIEIRPDTGVADLVRLEPGDICLFRITDDATPYAIADTAACDLEYIVVEA